MAPRSLDFPCLVADLSSFNVKVEAMLKDSASLLCRVLCFGVHFGILCTFTRICGTLTFMLALDIFYSVKCVMSQFQNSWEFWFQKSEFLGILKKMAWIPIGIQNQLHARPYIKEYIKVTAALFHIYSCIFIRTAFNISIRYVSWCEFLSSGRSYC